jgi:hypothetical protein
MGNAPRTSTKPNPKARSQTMTEQKTITIQGHDFATSQPYAAGHVATEAEAKALNQVRAENLRNNFASQMKRVKGDAETFTDEQLAALQTAFAEYDVGYEFTLASVGGGKRETDPVQAEAKKIAKTLIAAKLSAEGRTIKSIDPDVLANAIAKVAESEGVQKAAKKAVADRQKNAETALEGIEL